MKRDGYGDREIQEILQMKNVAVVGASRHPEKAAHFVPRYLLENGFNMIPVNPAADQIFGVKCHDMVSEIEGVVEIVDVFRPSGQVLHIVQDAIQKMPRVIWLQEGIYNQEAEQTAVDAGIKVVYNRCMLAEHMRLSSR